MNIVIHGAGFENKGAEAMLRTVQFEWSRRCPGTTFFLAARPPDVHHALLHGITPLLPAEPTPKTDRPLAVKLLSAVKARLKTAPSVRQSRFETIRTTLRARKLEQFDAFIDISGYQYGDAWGNRGFDSVMPWTRYCSDHNIPMVFLPQAWGPFLQPQVAADIRQLMAEGPLVMSRDRQSTQHLQTISPTLLPESFPDVAWLFDGASDSVGNGLLSGLGLDSSLPIVALVPNMRVYEKTGHHGASNGYLKTFANLASHVLDTSDASILLLPNEIRMPTSQSQDDRYLCSILETMIGNRQRCFVMRQALSAEALKALLSRCDAVVSSRFHSLIFSLSCGIPSLAVGWSHKYDELMLDLDIQEFSIACNTGTVADLTGPFNALWSQRNDINTRLPSKIESLKNRAAEAFDRAVAFTRNQHKG